MFLKDWTLIHPYPWLPCEDHSYLKQPFISAHPLKMLKSGNYNKVPILIGQTCVDGKFLDFRDYDFYDSNVECLTAHFTKFVLQTTLSRIGMVYIFRTGMNSTLHMDYAK